MRVRLRLERLQQLIATSGLSQNHWALKMGLSRGHWSDLVNGKHPYPSARTRQRMLELFEVAHEDLFEVEQGPTRWSATDFRASLADRYLIDNELGQGAMGAVYVARDLARGRAVALKVISPEAVSELGLNGFLREIGRVAQLHHPHILPLYDSGTAGDHPWYVMPWVRDGSLRQRLERDGRLPLSLVVELARGIGAALGHAHDHAVLHCDVKPENVLLYGRHAYLMDFGISRALRPDQTDWRLGRALNVSAGTPAYVSPEQAEGAPDLDARSDIYSFACVIYEMLTGKAPFEGRTTEEVVSRRFFAPPPPVRDLAPGIPAEVAQLVENAMALNRALRPAHADEFAESLAAAAARGRVASGKLRAIAGRTMGRARRQLAPSHGAPARSREQWRQDLRLALRGLRRSPGFVASVVVPLALGLGVGATLFGLVDRLFVRAPTGVQDPDRVARMAIAGTNTLGNAFVTTGGTWVDYEVLRRNASSFEQVAAYTYNIASLGTGPEARRIPVSLASASYFPLLGLRPARGRFYREEEDRLRAAAVPCVVSDSFWRAELGGADEAIGRSLRIGSLTCVVSGVTPNGFTGVDLAPVSVWIPIQAGAADFQGTDPSLWTTDGSSWVRMLVRVRDRVSPATADQDATRAYRSFAPRIRDPDLRNAMRLEPLVAARGSQRGRSHRTALWLAGGAAALLLLVTVNLANLFLVRGLGRARETAIRVALGGGRLRLFRLHFFEAVVLAAAAAAAALLIEAWARPGAYAVLFPTLSRDGPWLDLRVAILAGALALLIGAAVALVTTWQGGGHNPASLLRTAGAGDRGGGRSRLALVAVQAALSALLLAGSLGFVRSFRRAAEIDLGFAAENLFTMTLPLGAVGYDREASWRFYREALDRVRAEPGVVAASLAYTEPWMNNRDERVSIPGRDTVPVIMPFGGPLFDAVTPGHLETMGFRLTEGRWIGPGDRAGTEPVLVVTQRLAAIYWPREASVLGRCLRIGADTTPCRTIVGVIADYRFTGALDDLPAPMYFLPLEQAWGYSFLPRLFVRVRGDGDAAAERIRRIVQGMALGLPAASTRQLGRELRQVMLAPWRVGAVAFTGLGVLAALIAFVGLLGVLGYHVAQRAGEFAIRAALGGRGSQIAAPVLRHGIIVVGAGALVGLIGVILLGRWLDPLLFQVKLTDPLPLLLLMGLLVLSGAAAALWPARKAAARDPMEVLRAE